MWRWRHRRGRVFDGFGLSPPTTGAIGGDGGGIHNAGSLDLTSCTITLNQTGAGGQGGNSQSFGTLPTGEASGGPGGDGGGIYNAGDNAIILRNTLIAQNLINAGGGGGTNVDYYQTPILVGNAGPYGVGFDLAGNFTSEGFNLISISDGSTGMNGGVNADQVGSLDTPINPLLGPLQMNGGPTPTHALLPGSPAIDQGNSFGLKIDQWASRGLTNSKIFQVRQVATAVTSGLLNWNDWADHRSPELKLLPAASIHNFVNAMIAFAEWAKSHWEFTSLN